MAIGNFNGFENVRGTISKRTHFDDGKKVTDIVFAQVRGGKQRIYARRLKERTTPLSDNEIAARQRFKEASEFVAKLSNEQKSAFADQFKISKGRFNGKQYNSLRGYIVARYYAEYRQSAEQNGDK